MSFPRKRQAWWQHRYFSKYIYSSKLNHPSDNTNKWLIVCSICCIQLWRHINLSSVISCHRTRSLLWKKVFTILQLVILIPQLKMVADILTSFLYVLWWAERPTDLPCICISTDPEAIVRNEIGKYFLMKEASIGEPDVYLGGKVRKVELDTGEVCWAFSSSQYVQEACKNVRNHLKLRVFLLAF